MLIEGYYSRAKKGPILERTFTSECRNGTPPLVIVVSDVLFAYWNLAPQAQATPPSCCCGPSSQLKRCPATESK